MIGFIKIIILNQKLKNNMLQLFKYVINLFRKIAVLKLWSP